MMKRLIPILTGLALCVAAGCGRRAEPITSLQRKEAASLASEADFAVTIRDLPRAEKLLAKVVTLAPDEGDSWVNLGSLRMRMGNRSGAKSAYESALGAYESAAKLDPKSGEPLLQQIYVLALLGQVDGARKLLEKAQKSFPNDPAIRGFVRDLQLEALLANPAFKEISL